MAVDSPLADPSNVFTQIVRAADEASLVFDLAIERHVFKLRINFQESGEALHNEVL